MFKNISKAFVGFILAGIAALAFAATPMVFETPAGNSVKSINLADVTTFNSMGNGYTRFRTLQNVNVDIYDPSAALRNAAAAAAGVVFTNAGVNSEYVVMNNVSHHEITGGSNVTFYMSNGQAFGAYSDPNGTLNAAILALKLN